MSMEAEVVSDVDVPFHISEFPPCEIYVDRPLDNDDLCQRQISFADSRPKMAGQVVTIDYGKTSLYRINMADFDLLVSGIDEVVVSFGTYRRKELAGNIRSRGQQKDYRGKRRPVESWVYELVGSVIYV